MISLCGNEVPNTNCQETSESPKIFEFMSRAVVSFSRGPLFLFLTFRLDPLNRTFRCWHELKPVAAWREGNASTYGMFWKAVSGDVYALCRILRSVITTETLNYHTNNSKLTTEKVTCISSRNTNISLTFIDSQITLRYQYWYSP